MSSNTPIVFDGKRDRIRGVDLENGRYDIDSNLFMNYNIPQKTGRNLTWAVNWTQFDSSHKCWEILGRKANLYADSLVNISFMPSKK